MKCGYAKCKLGGSVEKEVAVKENKKYYHAECLEKAQIKREIEVYYVNKVNSREPLMSVRKAISNYIDRDNYNPNYVLWSLKKIALN